MEEIWMAPEGYEGYYALSNYGRLYSYPRLHTKGGFMNGSINDGGYVSVVLSKDGIQKRIGLNVLMYETFIGKVPNGMDVNHKDENKLNNVIWNLNLLSHEDNINYGTANERRAEKLSKKVAQYTKDMELVAIYNSQTEAQEMTGINQSHITDVCTQRIITHKDGHKYVSKTAGGYIWKFV